MSITVYMALGLPIEVANGTNRLPVLFQTLTASLNFRKQKLLDYKVGLRLGVPMILGALVGAQFAAVVNPSIFVILLASMLIVLLMLLIFSPQRILKGTDKPPRGLRWSDYVWFLLIGLYGGAFHIGMGYIILGITILAMGYDVMTANALKSFIVMLYIPFPLVIFMLHGQVDYLYGLVHAAGNVAGAYFASKYATRINTNMLRWALVVFMTVTVLDLLKIISIRNALDTIL